MTKGKDCDITIPRSIEQDPARPVHQIPDEEGETGRWL